MSTHTPGPWIVEGNMIRQPMLSKRRRIICPPDHDGIQDAAFIVRACNAHEDLVRALKLCVDALEFIPCRARNEAVQALAKSEGMA